MIEKEKTIRIRKISNGFIVTETMMDRDEGHQTVETYYEQLPKVFNRIYKADNRVERAANLAEGMSKAEKGE
jgi:hypothetical protein